MPAHCHSLLLFLLLLVAPASPSGVDLNLSYVESCLALAPSSSLAYPHDAEAHFDEIHTALAPWTGVVQRRQMVENKWMEHFGRAVCHLCCLPTALPQTATFGPCSPPSETQPLSATFGPFVPLLIPWTDLWVLGGTYADCRPWCCPPHTRKCETKVGGWRYPPGFVPRLLSVLRPDVLYLTVSQNDQGLSGQCELLMRRIPNVLVLSSGGFGHVPIPLLLKELVEPRSRTVPPRGQRPATQRRPLAAYVGSRNHGPPGFRDAMIATSERELGPDGFLFYFGPKWQQMMQSARVVLCPRGYGRTSYLVSETVQLGLIPVHVYYDIPWVPYYDGGGGFFETKIGFVTSLDGLPALLRRLKNMTEDEFARREATVKAALQTHYTYEGVMVQVERFIERAAGLRADSDLHCRPGGLPTLVKGFVNGADRAMAEKQVARQRRKDREGGANASSIAGTCS